MKKLLHSFSGFLIMLLVSCNVFVDDDLVVDNTKWVVPVHTGVGYDEPVTIHEGGCEMTYQLNSDVRVVEQEEQNKYIVSINCSEGNAVIELRYAANTPEELLPVPGEIYLSTATEKLPYGCNHRVESRFFRDGCYYILLTVCTLDETYKDLRLNGSLTGSEERTYSEQQFIEPAEEGEVIGVPVQQARSQTRGDEAKSTSSPMGSDKITETETLEVKFFNGNAGFGVFCPIKISKDASKEIAKTGDNSSFNFYGSVSVNFQYNVIYDYSFDNFNLKDDQLWLVEKCRKEILFSVTVDGGGQWHKDLIKLKAVPGLGGHAIAIGPLVLVLFAEHECSLDVTFTAQMSFTKEYITEQTTIHDLRDSSKGGKPSAEVLKPKVIKDTPVSFEVALSLDFSITYKFHLCIGFYGRIISFRIIPTFKLIHFNAKTPLYYTGMYKNAYTTSNKAGIFFSPLEFSIEIGVFIDLSFTNLLNAFRNSGKGEAEKEALSKFVDEIKKEKESYTELAKDKDYMKNFREGNVNTDVADKNQSKTVHGDKAEESNLHGLSFILGPWFPFGKFEKPWLPVIKEGSFKVVPSYKESDIENGGMSYTAQFKVEDTGILTAFKSYTPVICVTDEHKQIHKVYPTEGAFEKVAADHLYQFEIPTLKFDETYYIYPSFFSFLSLEPWALDQPQTVHPISREIYCSQYYVKDAKQNIFYDTVENFITVCMDINVAGDDQYDYWYIHYSGGNNDRHTHTSGDITWEQIKNVHKKVEKDGYKHYTFEKVIHWFTNKEEYDSYDENLDHCVELWFTLYWKYKESPDPDPDSRPLVGVIIYPGHEVHFYKDATLLNYLTGGDVKTQKTDYLCNYDERDEFEGIPRK